MTQEPKFYDPMLDSAGPLSDRPEKLRALPEILTSETGFPGIGVAIWREGENCSCRKMSVGEFLSLPENQSGSWLIDGGWGGPPGPLVVQWGQDGAWRLLGFWAQLNNGVAT